MGADLNHTKPIGTNGVDAIESPDGRFFAHDMPDGSWRVRDGQGHYFCGNGKVADRKAADAVIGSWMGKRSRGER